MPPQLFLIAAEHDTVAGVCGQLKQRASAMLDLSDPIVLRHEDGSTAHEITLQVRLCCVGCV
jgi:hypothetical protein